MPPTDYCENVFFTGDQGSVTERALIVFLLEFLRTVDSVCATAGEFRGVDVVLYQAPVTLPDGAERHGGFRTLIPVDSEADARALFESDLRGMNAMYVELTERPNTAPWPSVYCSYRALPKPRPLGGSGLTSWDVVPLTDDTICLRKRREMISRSGAL